MLAEVFTGLRGPPESGRCQQLESALSCGHLRGDERSPKPKVPKV